MCLVAERARWWTASRRRRHSCLVHGQALASNFHHRAATGHCLTPCQLPSASRGVLRFRYGHKCSRCHRSSENLTHFDRFSCASPVSWSERVGYARMLRRFESLRQSLESNSLQFPAWETSASCLERVAAATAAVQDLGGVDVPLVPLWPRRHR